MVTCLCIPSASCFFFSKEQTEAETRTFTQIRLKSLFQTELYLEGASFTAALQLWLLLLLKKGFRKKKKGKKGTERKRNHVHIIQIIKRFYCFGLCAEISCQKLSPKTHINGGSRRLPAFNPINKDQTVPHVFNTFISQTVKINKKLTMFSLK